MGGCFVGGGGGGGVYMCIWVVLQRAFKDFEGPWDLPWISRVVTRRSLACSGSEWVRSLLLGN